MLNVIVQSVVALSVTVYERFVLMCFSLYTRLFSRWDVSRQHDYRWNGALPKNFVKKNSIWVHMSNIGWR